MTGMVREIAKSYYLLLAMPMFLAVMAALATARELLMAAVLSVLLVAFALLTDTRPTIAVSAEPSKEHLFAGDDVDVVVRIRVRGGFGLITVAAPPASYASSRRHREAFEVVEGRASRVIFKGFREVYREYRIRVRALKRGEYEFGRLRFAYHHLFGLRIMEDEVDEGTRLVVVPRYRVISRSAGAIKPSTVTPRVTPNRLGPRSADFVDIREYVPGDPFKFINWKATARSTEGKLLVNDYEREGLRSVVFLMDTGPWMRLGYPHENPLEHGASLVLSLTKVLLRYGYNVGLWTLPPSGIRVIPSSGQTQLYRITRAILGIDYVAEPTYESMDPVLLRIIAETRPVLVIITNLAGRGAVEGVRRSLCADRGNECRFPGRALLVDVVHDTIAVRERLGDYVPAPCMGRTGYRARLYEKLPRGVMAVTWDPGCEGVGTAVARLMPRMRWLA